MNKAHKKARKDPGQAMVRNMAISFSSAIEARGSVSRNHSVRVSLIALALGKELGVRDSMLDDLEIGGLLHDVGRLCVSEEVLNYRGPFGNEQLWEMRNHPEYGAKILARAGMNKDICDMALYHHERFDGLGYPSGASGKAIPYTGRLLAVCDALESMLSDRLHRKGFGFNATMEQLMEGAGTQFDPEVAEAATRLKPRFLGNLPGGTELPDAGEAGRGDRHVLPDVWTP